jgi:hypothetical protein
MSISEALGERRTVKVPSGTLEYRERGTGAPMVFVHGAELADLHSGAQPGGSGRVIAQRSVEA